VSGKSIAVTLSLFAAALVLTTVVRLDNDRGHTSAQQHTSGPNVTWGGPMAHGVGVPCVSTAKGRLNVRDRPHKSATIASKIEEGGRSTCGVLNDGWRRVYATPWATTWSSDSFLKVRTRDPKPVPDGDLDAAFAGHIAAIEAAGVLAAAPVQVPLLVDQWAQDAIDQGDAGIVSATRARVNGPCSVDQVTADVAVDVLNQGLRRADVPDWDVPLARATAVFQLAQDDPGQVGLEFVLVAGEGEAWVLPALYTQGPACTGVLQWAATSDRLHVPSPLGATLARRAFDGLTHADGR
jgi:hypothetical protein